MMIIFLKRLTIFSFVLTSMPFLAQKNDKQSLIKGNKAYEKKQYDSAQAAYQQAIRENPKYYKGFYNLGNTQIEKKSYVQAEDYYNKAIEKTKKPNDKANSYYNLGNAYALQSKWDQAIDAYKKALKNNPLDDQARRNLTIVKHIKKQQPPKGGGGKDRQKQNQSDGDDSDQKAQKGENSSNSDQNNQNKENSQKSDKSDANQSKSTSTSYKNQAEQRFRTGNTSDYQSNEAKQNKAVLEALNRKEKQAQKKWRYANDVDNQEKPEKDW